MCVRFEVWGRLLGPWVGSEQGLTSAVVYDGDLGPLAGMEGTTSYDEH